MAFWLSRFGLPTVLWFGRGSLAPKHEQKKKKNQKNAGSYSSERSVGVFIKLRLRFYLLLCCLPWWTQVLLPVTHLVMVIPVYEETSLNDVQKNYQQNKRKTTKNVKLYILKRIWEHFCSEHFQYSVALSEINIFYIHLLPSDTGKLENCGREPHFTFPSHCSLSAFSRKINRLKMNGLGK